MMVVEGRTLDAGRSVQGFIDKNGVAIGAAVPPSMRTELDGAVTQLDTARREQDLATSTAHGETAAQISLRQTIYQTLVLPVGVIAARVVRESADLPLLTVSAAASRTASFTTKLANLTDTAAKYEALFVQKGLPADFIAQLRDGVTRLSASDGNRNELRARRSAATAGIRAAAQNVRDKIRAINGQLSQLRKDPAFEAGWQAAKHIQQVPVNPLPTGGVIVDDTTTDAPTATDAAATDTTTVAPPANPPVNPPATPPADDTKPSA